MTNVYKLCSLPEPLTAVIEIFWTYLSFSFRFIVRTCDMKTCEEQGQQDEKSKQQRKQETMRHYRQHQQLACMHHDSNHQT